MKSEKATDQVGRKLRSITSDIKRYVEKRLELMLVHSGEHFSRWMAISVQRTAGAVLLLVGVCFLFVALAIYLGNLLGSMSLGYVIVSIPLLTFGALFVSLKPRSLLEGLQQQFEAEVIEAIEQEETQELTSPEISNSLTEKD